MPEPLLSAHPAIASAVVVATASGAGRRDEDAFGCEKFAPEQC